VRALSLSLCAQFFKRGHARITRPGLGARKQGSTEVLGRATPWTSFMRELPLALPLRPWGITYSLAAETPQALTAGDKMRNWLSTKNHSPQRSTTRHPISTVSTANPPNPMPCALAVVLLPESRTVDICRKPCFRGRTRMYAGNTCSARVCVRGALMRRGRATGVGATT
jgi:hypothetical protein